MTYVLPLGASNGAPVTAPARYLNRHGLIAGATGTGKSVSLMGMAEAFQRLGVPSFVTDIKGDLSGLAAPSTATSDNGRNVLPWHAEAASVTPWDVFGEQGHALRASLADMGAPLAARALGLTDVQTGVLEVAYAVAADQGMPLHTLADLREVVAHCAEHRQDIGARYGLVTPSSVAAIGRAILRLERGGGAEFFSSDPTDIAEFVQGRDIHLLDCVRLMREPRLYGAVLLWLLDSLARILPEVGDRELPRLALFFDEAHLLFTDCPPDVLRSVEQTARLIRSKGVGVYFATQAPADVPDSVSRQLHLRVQHALRAVTPRDRSMVRAAADSLPPGEGFRVADAIEVLPPGSALVSFMGDDGKPTPARIVAMQLPRCRLSPLSDDERRALLAVTTSAPLPDTQPLPVAPVPKPGTPPAPPPCRKVGPLAAPDVLSAIGVLFGYGLALLLAGVAFNAWRIGFPGIGAAFAAGALALWSAVTIARHKARTRRP